MNTQTQTLGAGIPARAQHTPGPWTAWQPMGELGNKWLVSRRGTSSVCTVHNHGLRASQPEADANARLIAAAPDLLAACIELEGIILRAQCGHLVNIGSPAVEKLLDQARAAIAKAKGGAS